MTKKNLRRDDKALAARVHQIEADRVASKVCRHCGGPVPCWSPFGDQAVGKRHTAASLKARQR